MPSISNIFTFHHFDKELSELYISHTIRRFAMAMIIIFEPVYIFLYFKKSLSAVFLYFGAIALLYGILVPFGAKIMMKLGLKKAMLFSVPFLFFYYFVLWQINFHFLLIFLAIILRFFYALFYWPAYHTDLARFSKREFRGEQIGTSMVVYNLASVIAPLIGGFLLFKLGFPILFIIVLILLFVSAIPLFFTGEIREVYTDSYEKAFKQIFSKKFYKEAIAFAAFGFDQGISFFIWPIFMFVLAINYESMGLITSGALFLSLILTLYIGKLVDRLSRRRLLRIGSILTAAAWLFKTFIRTPLDAFLAQTIYRFAFTSCNIPYRAIMYDKASEDRGTLDRFIVFREMSHNVGRALVFIILAIIFFFVPVSNMYLIFPLAAIFALFFMLLGHKDES